MWFIIGQVFLAVLVHPGSHLQRASTELTYEMMVLSRILISLTSFHTIPDKWYRCQPNNTIPTFTIYLYQYIF